MNQPNEANPDLPRVADAQQSLQADAASKELERASSSYSDVIPPAAGQTSLPSAFPKIIKFESLARCGEEVWIETNGQVYRLRRTRQGKLILTK